MIARLIRPRSLLVKAPIWGSFVLLYRVELSELTTNDDLAGDP
jgi:hypothetical protein